MTRNLLKTITPARRALLLARLDEITLASLSSAVRGRLAARPDSHNMEKNHAS